MECEMAKKSRKSAPTATVGREVSEEGVPAKPARTTATARPLLWNLDGGAFVGLGDRHAAALHQSTLALSSGAEAIGKELIDLFGTTLENVGRVAEALLGARTMGDVVELNAELTRATVETLLGRSAKLSRMSIAVTREAVAPFGGSVDAVFATLAGSRDA
jgi:hypothetical protein